MTVHPEISHMDRDERIRAIAYALWEEEGRPIGRAEDHWLRACELIDAEAEEQPQTDEKAEPGWLKRAEELTQIEQPRSVGEVARKIAGVRAPPSA